MVFLPSGLIFANSNLSLPVYTHTFLKAPALLLITMGALIYVHCIRIFLKLGQGTPVPFDPPQKLVIEGLYQYSRNPMYIGYFLTLLGIFLMFGHFLLLIYLAAASWLVFLFVVYYEEPNLQRRFGESYLEYIRAVPRWL